MIDPLTLYLLRRGKSVINVQRLFPAYKAYPFPSSTAPVASLARGQRSASGPDRGSRCGEGRLDTL